MKISEWNLDDRPREKMERCGAGGLGNAELLAVILRSGARDLNAVDLARNILAEAGGTLTRLSQVPMADLCAARGIGKGKALSVMAALELGRRMMVENTGPGGLLIVSPEDVYDLMIPYLKGQEKESCWAVYLNRGGRVKGKERLSAGNDVSTGLDASDVARRAVVAKARRLILVHNHPLGDPTPSPSDIRLTAAVRQALKVFGIELEDHVIISDGAFFSFSRSEVTTCSTPARFLQQKAPVTN